MWVGWNFQSDDTAQSHGPWVDDIRVNYEPGYVTVEGDYSYRDRLGADNWAKAIRVELWDDDSAFGGDDDKIEFQNVVNADDSGHYEFPPILNYDDDDPDPSSIKPLDLYVKWVLENADSKVTDLYEQEYLWNSAVWNNIPIGEQTISGALDFTSPNHEAIWLFQDVQRVRKFFQDNINPTNPHREPGFIEIHWQKGQDSEFGIQDSFFWALTNPHVFVADGHIEFPDRVVHEIGHNIMWNQTGLWLWNDFNCFEHEMFSPESLQCAWSEGWAYFTAIAVNGDSCYDYASHTPCTGQADSDYFDLEHHTIIDPPPHDDPVTWGDDVEGRVAGALFDLMDTDNEEPLYDSASFGFETVIDFALKTSNDEDFTPTLAWYWGNFLGNQPPSEEKHHGTKSIFQNTIDYNSAPFIQEIMDIKIDPNLSEPTTLVELWNITYDTESPDVWLDFVVTPSNEECGVYKAGHQIKALPEMNWYGSCSVSVEVSDSIQDVARYFQVRVEWVDRDESAFLPILINNQP